MCDDWRVSQSTRVARSLERQSQPTVWWRALLGLVLLTLAAAMGVRRYEANEIAPWALPAILFVAALVLVWSPLDGAVQSDARRPDMVSLFSKDAWARVVSGVVLAGVAVVWLAQWDFGDRPLVRTIVVPTSAVLGAAMVLAPWWMRLIRQVSVERAQRVREFERAEIAAHLHDSVLQTLTLIRAKANDPDAVARLARAQERDLRAYLYQERRTPEQSVATALARAINEVEDTFGVAIDIVSVGDTPTTEPLAAAVLAAKEAAQNAAKHGREPISVYAELTASDYEVYVRDAGPGFDPGSVAPDRAGITHSIVGRAARHGGTATIHSAPGRRTEVAIVMPRKDMP